MALVCLSLLVWFIRAPEDRLLAHIRVDRSYNTQALAQMIVIYLALERSRRSRRNDNTSGSRDDSRSSEDRGTDHGECANLRAAEVETEELIPSSSFISNISPSLARRQAWPSRSLIEYQLIVDTNGEQTNVGVYQSECTPVSASTLLDDCLRESLTLVLSYIWRATCSTLCSAAHLDPVVVNSAFRDLVYGNPCVRLQTYSSTSAFFASLFVQLYPRPKSVLLIEYPQPLEILAPVPNILFSAGRHREVLRLVQPHLEASALSDSSLLAGPSQLVARAFRSVVYGDPYMRLVTQMSIAVFLEGLFARFEVRVGQPAKLRLMIEYRRSTEVAHKASGDTIGPVSDPDASISYLVLRLSLGQRKEVVALVSDYVDTRKAEYVYPLVTSANIFAHHAFRSSVLGDSSSRVGFLALLAAFYAPLVVRLKEYRPELDLIRLTRRTPPRVRPGAEMYRPRALQRDDSSNEERRQRLAKQEQRLIEAARRREQVAQEEPQSLLDAPTKRRRRPRAGRKVRERREREEEERLTLLGSGFEEET
ncbi:hypothetical protein BDV93DRAFT_525261 [Ceratobasidium sp. AG-I]|nr:hypothetical protein BDV93DRAFT_525261 [Ceratobasidium sp. AG-I]